MSERTTNPCESDPRTEEIRAAWLSDGPLARQLPTIAASILYLLDRNKALEDENARLRERQESHDLANEGIRQKRRALKAEAERDRLRTVADAARAVVKSFQGDAISVFRVKMDTLTAALDALDGGEGE